MSLPGIFAALRFAAERHSSQLRKGVAGYPYINHVIAVSELLARCGVDDVETIQAALLHDTIEDTDTTPEELAAAFGAAVRDLVLEISDDTSLARGERKRLQVAHAAELSARARRIKIADKTCNIADIAHDPPPDWSVTRRREYLAWAEAVVHHCLGVGPAPLERAWHDALAAAREVLHP
ncbi:MAG TPA: HD domain-containing protein [Longimicrobiales bacterium]|nr:HD domain-containing protein [Longimicrobiales bacterium]